MSQHSWTWICAFPKTPGSSWSWHAPSNLSESFISVNECELAGPTNQNKVSLYQTVWSCFKHTGWLSTPVSMKQQNVSAKVWSGDDSWKHSSNNNRVRYSFYELANQISVFVKLSMTAITFLGLLLNLTAQNWFIQLAETEFVFTLVTLDLYFIPLVYNF